MEIMIESHIGDANELKDAAVKKFLVELGLMLEGDAKIELENDPRRVDTGLLRNSITFALDGEAPFNSAYKSNPTHDKTNKPVDPIVTGKYEGTTPKAPEGKRALYVGTNVEYAKYVSEGVHGNTGNRFLKKAVAGRIDEAKEKLEEALKNAEKGE